MLCFVNLPIRRSQEQTVGDISSQSRKSEPVEGTFDLFVPEKRMDMTSQENGEPRHTEVVQGGLEDAGAVIELLNSKVLDKCRT